MTRTYFILLAIWGFWITGCKDDGECLRGAFMQLSGEQWRVTDYAKAFVQSSSSIPKGVLYDNLIDAIDSMHTMHDASIYDLKEMQTKFDLLRSAIAKYLSTVSLKDLTSEAGDRLIAAESRMPRIILEYNIAADSCNRKYRFSDCGGDLAHMELEAHIYKLKYEEQALRDQAEKDYTTPGDELLNKKTNYGEKYCFVVLTYKKKEFVDNSIDEVNKMYYYTSAIFPLADVDETIKYKCEDTFQNTFTNSAESIVYKGKVTDRNFFSYNTYTEASKAREEYTTQK